MAPMAPPGSATAPNSPPGLRLCQLLPYFRKISKCPPLYSFNYVFCLIYVFCFPLFGHDAFIVIVIVIVISEFLKRYSKAKRTRAPAYSRALRRIKGRFPNGGQEKLRSDFQSTRKGQSSC